MILRARAAATALLAALLGAPVAATALLATAPVAAAADAPPAVPSATADAPVVVAGVAGLEWSDLDRSRTPNLWRLVGGGDVASIAVRTLAPTCPVDAWLTMSAGSRVTRVPAADGASADSDAADDAEAPALRCRTVPRVTADRMATTDGARGAAVSGWKALTAPDASATGSYGHPGTLGDALAHAGACSTAFGPGAAVALARSGGRVERYLPDLTSGTTPDGGELSARLTACPVSVVDLGELPDPAPDRAAALRDLDAELGTLDRALPDGARLIVAGIADTPLGPRGLQVAVERTRGDDATPAWLSSGSSRREGVVVANDLSATLADAVGVDTAGFDGSPLVRGQERRLDTRATVENRQYLTTLTQTAPPLNWAVLGLLGLAVVLCVPVLVRRPSPRARRLATATLTVAALLPAGASLATLTRWWSSPAPGPVLAAAVAVPAVLLALVAWAVDRPLRHVLPVAWRRPIILAGLTWLVLTVDGLSGTTLQQGSPLGPSLALGARFYGFGNTVFAVYAVAGVVLAAGLAVALRVRGRDAGALVAAGVVGLVTVLVDGLPMFGADAGGIVSLVPAFVVLLLGLAGQRVRARHWLLAAGATLLVALVVALAAWVLPGGSHLGRFVQRIFDGDAVALVAAKASGAWSTVASVPGVLAVAVVVAAAWAVLAPGRRPWGRLAPLARTYAVHPALRAAVLALVVVAGAGSVLNDTGIAVALVVLMLSASILATGRWVVAVPDDVATPDPGDGPGVRLPATTLVTVGGGILVALLLVAGMLPPSSDAGVAGGQTSASPLASNAAVGTPGTPLVVVGTEGLRWPDVRPDGGGALARLLADGADAGGVSLPTGRAARCAQGGWLALSAGQLAEVADTRDADGAWQCPPLAATPAGQGATVDGWDALVALQQGSGYEARLGRLGDALASGTGCTTAVGPGAAVALADGSGRVPRYRTLAAALDDGPDAFECPVTVVDAGAVAPGDARAGSVATLAATVGRLVAAAPANATVVVVDVATEPEEPPALGVAMVRPGTALADRPRYLSSTATRTDGVARLQDVPATLLHAAGVAVPSTLDDTPLVRAGARPADAVATADALADVTARDHVRRAAYVWFVDVPLYAGLVLAAACLLVGRSARRPRRWQRFAEGAALTLGALPAAAFLGGLTGWWRFASPPLALALATVLTTAVVAGLAALAPRRPVWARTAVVAGITFGALTLDGITGTPLNRTSPLGSAPTFGARFYGFGNPTFSVYAVAGLLLAAALAQVLVRRQRPRLAAAVVGVIGLVAMVVDVWPTLGADLGGGLVLVPAFVVVGLAASGARVTLRRFVAVAAAGVAAVAAIGVLDWLRPPAERSHLGRFVAQVVDGEAWGIVARKGGYALRSVLGGVPVWLTVAVLLLAAVPLLGTAAARARWTPGWFTRAEALWPLLRPAVLAIWTIAVLGSFVNDFGVRIAMIALIPAVPLVTLVALSATDAERVPTR